MCTVAANLIVQLLRERERARAAKEMLARSNERAKENGKSSCYQATTTTNGKRNWRAALASLPTLCEALS